MITPILQISFILIGAALMLSLLGLAAVVIMPSLNRWSKNFFFIYFLTLSLYVGFSLAELIGYSYPEMSNTQLIFIAFHIEGHFFN